MMKRLIALLLAVFLLSGCALSGNRMNDPVTFYYLRESSNDGNHDAFFFEGVIGSEIREASGKGNNLEYLLTLYFRGPLDPELVSPFPLGCRVVEINLDNNELTLLLNPILGEKSDLDITLACACLARTCLDLTDADTVRIESKNLEDKVLFSRVFTEDSFFLSDDYIQPVESTENNP